MTMASPCSLWTSMSLLPKTCHDAILLERLFQWQERNKTEQEGNGPLDSRAKVMISDKKFGLTELRKFLCTWFGEVCSCCSLSLLPQPACNILATMCKQIFSALYLVSVLLWPPVVLDQLTIVWFFKALFTSDFKFELSGPNNQTLRNPNSRNPTLGNPTLKNPILRNLT